MTTDLDNGPNNLDKFNENLARVEELSRRLVSAMSTQRSTRTSLQAPGPDLWAKTSAAYVADAMANPSQMIEKQAAYWGKTLAHFAEVQRTFAEGRLEAPSNPGPKDPRFSNPLWDSHPYFNYVKQQFLSTSAVIEDAFSDMDELEPADQKRAKYFSQQIIDMFSPTNFLGTNPEALTHAMETDGQSLVDGLENLVRDIEGGDGQFAVQLADKDAFEVGGNIATTPGSVVFQNRLFELIQYTPTTEKVHKTPLVIFPPWINRFYIMDLAPQKSLIKWIVDQGYTLFVVSWKNPDASYRDVRLDDYVTEGYLTAFDQIKEITGEKQVSAVGYCIAGTTLALTLALMKKRGDKSVKSATFFTTLTDFSDQGEIGVFLDDDFVDGIEEEVNETGILSSFIMSRTFSFLRSNDLIYGPAVRSYMMGQRPPAFDLLYWNGDGTDLPAAMTVQYLRELCQGNYFAQDGIEICGETLKISDVSHPLFAIACETDHIAAWKASFDGIRKMGSKSKTFVLAESGHIAGIINPPSKKKYNHFMNDAELTTPEEWQAGATKQDGSWWGNWEKWLKSQSGKQVDARLPGDNDRPILGPAPGTYVKG